MRWNQVGRLFVVGFDGPSVTPELREMIRRYNVTGAILFRRNVESAQGLVELVRELRGLRGDLIVTMDHEGGRVTRIGGPFTELPPAAALGKLGDEETANAWGKLIADEMLAAGIDTAFCPVMDVDSNPDNPVIGDRAFSSAPGDVAKLGAAAIDGMHERGFLACAKHFPGHGDTEKDSHVNLPFVERPRKELDEIELPPFRAAVEAGVDMVMTAHVVYTALDEERPATMSPDILSILREEWNYPGVIVSDDLEMKAIADRFEPGEAAVSAVSAGCDLLLACHSHERQVRMIEALISAAESERIPMMALEASVKRVEQLTAKARKITPIWNEAKKILGRAAHQRLADKMRKAL